MDSILNFLTNTSNQTVIISCMCLAAFRIYLEVIRYDFNQLPISKLFAQAKGAENMKQFHRMGLYLSVGYIVLFAPGLLFS